MKNHYIQLVTSNPDCCIKWVCVLQVVDKTVLKRHLWYDDEMKVQAKVDEYMYSMLIKN